MLNIMRRICLLVTVCFIRSAVSLACRMTTVITQMKKTTLTTMTMKIGARNAPSKAPICDRKQLQFLVINDKHTFKELTEKQIVQPVTLLKLKYSHAHQFKGLIILYCFHSLNDRW